MYDWAKTHFNHICVEFYSKEEYESEEILLKERFNNAMTIEGTQQVHAVIPVLSSEVMTKYFSNSDEFTIVPVFKNQNKTRKRRRV